MSKRSLGLLLGVWIGSSGVAHAVPALTVSPQSPVDFGSARVLNTAASPTTTRVFTFTNSGNSGTLSITDITFTGNEYTLNPAVTFPLDIEPGLSENVTVQFNPNNSGTRTSSMTIVSNVPDRTLQLTGVGTTAIIAATDVAFGTVDNGTSSTQNVTVANSATQSRGPLTVTSATITGSTFYSFGTGLGCNGGTTCTFNPPLVITAGTSTVPVVCAPPATGTGSPSGTVTFTSDTDGGGDSTAALSCTAGHANISIAGTLAFGDVAVGASSTRTITISNSGTTTLTYNLAESPELAPYAIAAASCTMNCPVPAGMMATFDVTFTPTAFGLLTSQIVVTSNDPDPGDDTLEIAVSGTGRQGVLTTTPSTIDFGGIGVGSTSTQMVTLRNTGNVTVNNIAGALSNANLGYQFNLTTNTLAGGAQTTVQVTFAPLTANDGGPATLTFSGTWSFGSVSNAPTMAQVMLNGDGLAVSFTAAPATLDFMTYRFDSRPQKDYQIRNSGETDIAIASAIFTPDPGTTAGELAITIRRGVTIVTLPQTLTPGQQLDVAVVAQPNRTGLVGGHIDVHSTTPGTTDQRVTITGNATSALYTAAAVDFGAVDMDGTPPARTAEIVNNGTAVLDVTSIAPMAGASPAFVITLPPSGTKVMPGTPLSIPITYTPTIERGPNDYDTAVLVITLGGVVGTPQATMLVRGRGIDRHVMVDPVEEFPATVPAPGDAGPTRMITIRNGGEAPLEITGAKLTPEADWQLVAPRSTPFTLGDSEEQLFTVRFTPTVPGAKIDGELTLTTNDSDHRTMSIPLSGDSLIVDAHGSGGCNTGGAGPGGALAIGLAALLALRRRRRLAWLAAIPLVALAPAALADDAEVMVFEPTPATTGTSFQLQSPEVGVSGSWVASSILSYASDPFAVDVTTRTGEAHASGSPVKSSSLLQLGIAYAFLDRFEVGAHLPLYMQSGEPVAGFAAADGGARGNLSLHGKVRLAQGGGLVAGASVIAIVPTATQGQHVGSDQPEARLLVLGSFTPAALRSRVAITANAGPILRGKSEIANISLKTGAAWGVGGSYRVLDSLWATAEVFGKVTPSARAQKQPDEMVQATTLSQIEWLAGVSLKVDRRFTVGLAAGRGLTDALGTPDLRGVLSLAFVPGAPAVAPIRPPEPPRPAIDSDGDGVLDSADKCPDEPEDKDMFDDADGCPDKDNDRDGIADAQDKCPLEPEDKDGFEDRDGCADKDNDRDGVADAQDLCPNAAEDKDGFEDIDGCPEPDNDRDGIADAQDKCPNEPETINAIKDDDGCPDKGDTTIVLSPDRIETLDPIGFTGLKLARPSLTVLAQVGATLRAHGEIVRVRITVHVQPSNDPDADQAKSDKRAQAVRDWLVQWGIAPARLEIRGFGGNKPLVPADQRGAARINDRVELIILERK